MQTNSGTYIPLILEKKISPHGKNLSVHHIDFLESELTHALNDIEAGRFSKTSLDG